MRVLQAPHDWLLVWRIVAALNVTDVLDFAKLSIKVKKIANRTQED